MVRNIKGFTLVELMIVIAIIGVLAVALIPTLTGAQSKARDTGRISAITNASTSLLSYRNDSWYFPSTDKGCLTDANWNIASYKDNASTPADVTAEVAKVFNGWKAPVDSQGVKLATTAWTAARSIKCDISKSYGYQAWRLDATGIAYTAGILIASIENYKQANAKALPTDVTTNGQLVVWTMTVPIATDTVKLFIKTIE